MPFVIMKALSFLPFGGFLKNPKVLIGIILIAVAVFGYYKWKGNIIERVENEIFTSQAKDLLEQQKREFETQQHLQEKAARQTQRLSQQRENLLRDIERLRADVRSSRSEDDGPVAPVLSTVLESIRIREKGLPAEPNKEPTVTERVKGAVDGAVETGNSAIDEWRRKLKGESK